MLYKNKYKISEINLLKLEENIKNIFMLINFNSNIPLIYANIYDKVLKYLTNFVSIWGSS
mgnify:CR=1 FL=1